MRERVIVVRSYNGEIPPGEYEVDDWHTYNPEELFRKGWIYVRFVGVISYVCCLLEYPVDF